MGKMYYFYSFSIVIMRMIKMIIKTILIKIIMIMTVIGIMMRKIKAIMITTTTII